MSNATEYQQVAAITSMDIDILAKIAGQDNWTAEDLREFIFRLKKQKDLLISVASVREMRYNATTTIFNIASKK
jgi:hypothetical protein